MIKGKSPSMNQKSSSKPTAPKRRTPPKQKPVEEIPVEAEPEELTGPDLLLQKLAPHATTIVLAVVAAFVGFASIAYLYFGNQEKAASEWHQLYMSKTVALQTNNMTGLEDVADTYPDSQAGMWASQKAGDFQLRRGLKLLETNRESGLALIQKATKSFDIVLKAPVTAKTDLLQRRSQFGMAYACESLGQFDRAHTLYKELVDAAPDSGIAVSARRGVIRSSNPDYVALYKKFEEFEIQEGDAPDAILPGRQNIEFGGTDLDATPDVTPVDEPATPDSDESVADADDSNKTDSDKSAPDKS